MTGRRIVLCLVLLLFMSSQASAASLSIIVQLSPGAVLNTVLNVVNGVVVDAIPGANIYLLNVPSLPLLSPVLSLLGVQSIEVNRGVTQIPFGQLGVLQTSAQNPADWYKNQPAFQLVRSPEAFDYATGRGVVIADINSQYDYSHPALVGHLTSGFDFVSSRSADESSLDQSSSGFLEQSSSGFLDQSSSGFLEQSSSGFLEGMPLLGSNPAYSHGTLTAGVLAAIAPDAMIMPLRAFDDDGSSDLYTLAKAIRYAVSNGAEVINMSFGTYTDSSALRNAIQYAKSKNVVLVASAGNSNSSAAQYPAAYSGVISVAATDLTDKKGSFSNYGSYVAMDAPGVNIISAYPGGLYSMVSGTSFSSPIVAGTAALVRSMKSTGISGSITGGAVNIDGRNPSYAGKLGAGRVDVLNAIHP